MATETQAPAVPTHGGDPIVHEQLYIGGEWVDPVGGGGVLEVVDSTTEEVMGRVPEATAGDVDRAVAAARSAFEVWSQTTLTEREEACRAIAAGLAARGEEIAALISREVGMPLNLSVQIQAGLPAMSFSTMPTVMEETIWEENVGNSLIVREAVGVVGAITPWNYPLHQLCAKVAPALAAGCTVVAKPSEVTPLNAFILAEVIDEAGLPGGVFNLVPGTGPAVGEAMTRHPGIDMISFTGSTAAGRKVSQAAAETVKRVALELGGKSPAIVLDDADLQKSVVDVISRCYLNSGQTCSALTRMLVPRERLAEAEAIAAAVAQEVKVGDPFDQDTTLGPLVSDTQRERVRGYIRKGQEEGAKLVAGGEDPPADADKGYFVQPTVFSEVAVSLKKTKEEIFGPVL